MKFRKAILIISLIATSLATSCTARYQDMLRDRDDQIRSLNGDLARLRGENDELHSRLSSQPSAVDASASNTNGSSLLSELQEDIGQDADVSLRRGRISIGVNNRVTFDSGSTKLKKSSNAVLRRVASALSAKFAGRQFFIEGHTDSDPILKTRDKYRSNRHLSMERADAVAAFLIKQGVPEKAIVTVGRGPFDPIDPRNKASNRRVEIVVANRL
jgi:chemotaxis protein MotB